MNSAALCLLLLSCVAICSSQFILKCRCLEMRDRVNPHLIVEVMEYEPRPYCNKREVVVKLKNNVHVCLNPESKVAQHVLKRYEILTAARATTQTMTANSTL